MHVHTIQCEIAGIQLTPLDDVTLQRPCWWTRTKAFPSPDGLPHIKILVNERSPFLVAPLRLHNLFSGRGCCMVQGIKKFNSTNYSSFSLLDSSKTPLLSTGEREPLVKRRLLAPPPPEKYDTIENFGSTHRQAQPRSQARRATLGTKLITT